MSAEPGFNLPRPGRAQRTGQRLGDRRCLPRGSPGHARHLITTSASRIGAESVADLGKNRHRGGDPVSSSQGFPLSGRARAAPTGGQRECRSARSGWAPATGPTGPTVSCGSASISAPEPQSPAPVGTHRSRCACDIRPDVIMGVMGDKPVEPHRPRDVSATWNDPSRIAFHRDLSPSDRIRLTIEASRAALRFASGRRLDEH